MQSKLKIISTLSILILSFHISAQITFEKTYGSTYSERATSVHQTVDGGYIIGGTNLVKIDKQGQEEWSKPYPSKFANITSDNGYILINGNSNIFFTKVDSNGDTLWTNSFKEGIWSNEGNYIEQTLDGGYIVTGRFQSVTGSGLLLLKLNSTGNKEWHRTFSEPTSAGFCTGYSVKQTAGNGYILTGTAHKNFNDSTRNNDVFIVKTDSLGNEQWRRFFGGTEDDAGYSVLQDNSGNYIIAGRTNSYGFGLGANMYLIKLDANGDSLLTQTYGGNFEETATSITQTSDNGYIISGSSNTFTNGDFDGYVVKTDNNGDTLWTKHYGYTGIESTNSGEQTTDNGYIFAGFTNSIGAGGSDMYILKTDSLGNIHTPNSVIQGPNIGAKINVYPNPSYGSLTFNSKSTMATITLLNVIGKMVYSENTSSKSVELNLINLPKGVYIYQIQMKQEEVLQVGRIVIQ